MIHCTQCGLNWAKLWQASLDNTDETIEFCPICNTDLFLEEVDDFEGFIRCRVTGKITNVVTGEEYHHEVKNPNKRDKLNIRIWDETPEEFEQRRIAFEDECIEKGSFAGYEPIKRKFHFETINN